MGDWFDLIGAIINILCDVIDYYCNIRRKR